MEDEAPAQGMWPGPTQDFGNMLAWIQTLPLSHQCCVILGKLLNLPEPHFLHKP